METLNFTKKQATLFVHAFNRADKLKRYLFENRYKINDKKADNLMSLAWEVAQNRSPVLLFENGILTSAGSYYYNMSKIAIAFKFNTKIKFID
jgi:hypothetical protein